MKRIFKWISFCVLFSCACGSPSHPPLIQDVKDSYVPKANAIWLSHEHILVDFIGADQIHPESWDHDSIFTTILPYLEELGNYEVQYFVDATPNYLGRNARLLQKIVDRTDLKIITNTGLYGARQNKFIPKRVFTMTHEEIGKEWIKEFKQGINGTDVKPGFIKIGIDAADPLDTIHQKLVKAAALTHLKTGLTIASHTGPAIGLWPQMEILNEMGVSPKAFIWVHAQNEDDHNQYLEAAKTGCWISLDGIGWEVEKHAEKILFSKEHLILDQILISHDAGWYDPQKEVQEIQSYRNIFTQLIPLLEEKGFTEEEIHLLLSENPSKAFGINIRKSKEKN